MFVILIAIAWLLGLAAAAFTDAAPGASVAAAGLLGAATFAYRPRASTLLALPFAFAVVALALVRYDDSQPQPDSALVQANADGEVTVIGVVDDEPRQDGRSAIYRLRVERIEGTKESGDVLIWLPAHVRYDYGDRIEVTGDLDEPPVFDTFDYREYLLRQGITSVATYPETRLVDSGNGTWHRELTFDVRERLDHALSDALPEPEASLAAGVLFGGRGDVPDDLRESMSATGTSHLVAVSGQNITILAGLIVAALAWFIGRRPACWFALVAVVGYTLLCGFEPSVIRASIMGVIYILTTVSGRQNATLIALAYAAAIMTAMDPQIVHDVGFQLSMAATIGLATLATPIRNALEGAVSRTPIRAVPAMRGLTETAAVSLAAIGATLPISAITFERISIVAPLANLFAVPAFVAVAVTAAVGAGITLVVPSAAPLAGFVAWPAAAYVIGVIEFFADVPGASVGVSGASVWHAMAWYAAMALAWRWVALRQKIDKDALARLEPMPVRRLVPQAGLASVALMAAAIGWLTLADPNDNHLSVTFLDVGQGDSVLIEDAGGHRVLIDGGPGGDAINLALSRHLPFYDRRIDLVVLTHPDSDHVGGLLDVLIDYDVRAVMTSAGNTDSSLAQEWRSSLVTSGAEFAGADAGKRVTLNGATLEVLAPDADDVLLPTQELNETSTVLRLTSGDVSFLFTGDIGETTEAALIRSGADVDATVLKVGHHGSRFSSSEAFLAAVSPSLSVVSVGADNRYGQPSEEAMDRLSGDVVLRTDEDGDITVMTDGAHVWVQTQR
jgi:competence protein ComEC